MPPHLVEPAAICASAAFVCWLLSVVTREYSWVDRLWSLLPPVYLWMFAAGADFDPRVCLMAVLVTAWGARLTFNFWRKGGYAPGGEDYRWAILRARMPAWAWQVFNLLFTAGYQNLLIFLFTLPAAVVAGAEPTPLGPVDLVASLLFVGLLTLETVADQQQWNFHLDKKRRIERGEVPDEPFCRRGLWAWSRHPNFFAEQAQWWVLTLFPLAVGVGWLNYGVVGAFLLTLLFDGSTRFTERISLSKNPSYAEYQRTTSRWLPLPPRR